MQNAPTMPASPPPTASIRVALVEDDPLFREAIADAIRSAADMELAGVAGTREQGLLMLHGPAADVLLVDLGLPDGSGIDVIAVAQTLWPRCESMVATTFGDEAHVLQSIEAGACGYLLKDSSPARMLEEIRNLRAGGSPISPLIARQVLKRFRGRNGVAAAPAPLAGEEHSALSVREQQTLEYVTKGFTYDEVAGLLGVSRHTVQTFVRRIYAKLEVSSKVEAIYEARKRGLLAD
jgi:DNA-binding NarL/FixJ family response regulator